MFDETVDYLRCIRTRSATATYQRKRQMAESFVRYFRERGRQLVDVRKNDVEAYLHTLGHCCHETKQMHCRTVRELYDVLKMPENPASDIYFRRVSRRKIKLPSKPLLDRALAQVNRSRDIFALRDALMVELAYGSGLRKEELWRMNIEDVDLTTHTAYILGKGKTTRIVPLTSKTVDVARAYLESRQAGRGPLFVSRPGRRLGGLRIYQVFKEKTGYRPHLFRHACATHMLQNGCNIRIVQELLGHRFLTSTQQYTHITKEELRVVVKRFHPRSGEKEKGLWRTLDLPGVAGFPKTTTGT
jgi:site-specific recombinase XerD